MKQTNIEHELLKTVRSGIDSIDELVQRLQTQENEYSKRGEYVNPNELEELQTE